MVLSDSSDDESFVAVSSLQECLALFTSPLGRDHPLVRKSDRSNRIRVSDVITGTGTECELESSKRKRLAFKACPRFIDELSYRNVGSLGVSLVKALLNVETDTDEEGVPIEEDESKVCEMIGRILIEIQAKSRDHRILEATSSAILDNSEVLLYQKYKYLKSVKLGAEMLTDTPSTPATSTTMVAFKPETSISVVRARYTTCVSSSLSAELKRILNSDEASMFVNNVLINELVDTQIVLSKTSEDSESLIPMIRSLVLFLKKQQNPEEDSVKALLRLLTCTKQILLDVAEDASLVSLLRITLGRILDTKSLSADIREVIQVIHQCISF